MEWTVMAMILGNCVTLVMFDHTDRECRTEKCQQLAAFDIFFSALSLLECAIRITAKGFRGFWKSHWNKLDFIIVAFGCVSSCQESCQLL